MSLIDRINRVVKTKLNNIVTKAEDSERILELLIIDMEEDLLQLRQEVAQLIFTQKRTQQQYNHAVTEKNNWLRISQLARSKVDENLANEALGWRKSQFDYIDTIKATLEQQTAQLEYLKRRLIVFESNLSEVKIERELLKSSIAK
jgi:phage shock protein A